ncbi:MAG TPA: HdeD family acid-resistance protein [Candidatus Limnocylindria bacterium]
MAVRFDMAGTVALARWWWTFVVRGLLAIAFGVLAFFAPGLGIAVLVGLFAAWALIDGVTSLVTGIGGRNRDRSWWLEILEGVVSIIAGIIALAFPVLAAEVLVIIIAAWAIVTGIFEIIAAIRLREQIKGEFWLGLAGLASILFGVILLVFPGVGALSLVWLIGSFALVFGVFLVILGWRLRGVNEMAKVDAARDYSR